MGGDGLAPYYSRRAGLGGTIVPEDIVEDDFSLLEQSNK